MIPILYDANEREFISNGIGRLAEATSCKVTEERNGEFTLELTYPINGALYDEIKVHRIIYAAASDTSAQPFDIYNVVANMDGTVTVYANHVSYRLNGMPFLRSDSAFNGAAALMAAIPNNVPMNGNTGGTNRIDVGFDFTSTSTSTAAIRVNENKSVRSVLHGSNGSLLDVCGGEFEFNKFSVIHRPERGKDNGVVVRYGKNLTDLTIEYDANGKYNGFAPFYKESDTVYRRANTVYYNTDVIPYPFIKLYDAKDDYSTTPTTATLNALSNTMLSKRDDKIDLNITFEMFPLWASPEYARFKALEAVGLCDIVRVINERMGIDVKTKVVSMTYDSLLERPKTIEIGTIKKTLADTIAAL